MTERPSPRGRDAYRHWTRMTMRSIDNNGAGHIDNSIYYGWFDTALISWLTAQHLMGRPESPVVFIAESRCRYLSELSFPGVDVEIGFVVDRIGTSSIGYSLGVFASGSDSPAAEGGLTQVCIDPATRRPTPLPDVWRTTLATVTAGFIPNA